MTAKYILFMIILLSYCLFGQSQAVRFIDYIPERIKLIESVRFNFVVDKNIVSEYRYKLVVPTDWLGGISYSLKAWSQWYENNGSNVVYSEFKIEGRYKFIVQYRENGSSVKNEIIREIEAYWEYPEILSNGFDIDISRLKQANSERQRNEILAEEFYEAYKTWEKKYEYQYQLLKLTTSKEEILNKLGATIAEESVWKLSDAISSGAKIGQVAAMQWLRKIFLPRTLYLIIKEGLTDLILIMRNVEANEAAFATVLYYYCWEYYSQKAKSVTDGEIMLGFILDSSGSMTTTDPYDIRKSGVKQIIGLLEGTEKVFIVEFDSRATWLNSTNYKGWNKYQLQSEIDRIDSDGGTNIGSGISEMQNALQNEINPNSKAGVILLTDGDGDYNNEAQWFSSMNIPIFTISYKENAVSTLMNEIANVTNGQYIKANNEGDIVSAFTQFYNEILGNSKFLNYNNTISMGETITHPGFFIEPGCSMINGNLSYLGSKISLTLITPAGIQISEGDSNAEWIIGSNYASVKIDNPESGRWTAIFNGVDIPPNGEPFVFEVNGNAPNTIRLIENTAQGGPISFSLFQERGSIDISRLDAEVEVLTPKNNLLDITENFTDGSFRYLPLEGKGDYQFWINISGKDNSGNSIQRHFKKSVLVGDFVPFYIGEVINVMGSIIKAKLGTNVGNQAGLKCYVYSAGKNINEKNAIGYVTFVSDEECTIEIQQYFENQLIKRGDIVELDITHWLSDSF